MCCVTYGLGRKMKVEKIENIDEIKQNHPHLCTVYAGYVVDNTYRILLAQTGKFRHIRIRRLDDKPISDFVCFQQIKNTFLGEETVAVQVFPKVSDYVDNSNTYHLFSWDGMEVPNLKNMYEYK